MDDLPPVTSGYIRLVWFPDQDTREMLHADVLRLCDENLDNLGHIQIRRRKIYIDVMHTVSHDVRERLNEYGRCTVAENSLHQLRWVFIRLGVGRNHGLNLGYLKKLMKRLDAGPLGKISINNTYTLLGLREDKIESVVNQLKNKRINGYASQARLAEQREVGRKEAQYIPESTRSASKPIIKDRKPY